MSTPTAEEVQRGVAALAPFVEEWRLPLNPENLHLIAYAVLMFAQSPAADAIQEGVRKLIREEAAAHDAMVEEMKRPRGRDSGSA